MTNGDALRAVGELAPGRDSALALAVGLVATVVFLWCRPYLGLHGDAQLYAMQALARIHPDDLGADLFLYAGSQDQFTVFSGLYGPLVSALGLPAAALTVCCASACVLYASTYLLLRTWCLPSAASIATLLLAVWPVPYGVEGLLQVAQPLATPRMLAEALALVGITLTLRGHAAGSVVALGLSASLHPLMAAPAIGVALTLGVAAARDRKPARLAAVLVAVLAVGSLAVAVGGGAFADRLFVQMDDAWRGPALQRSPFLSPALWPMEVWANAFVCVAVPAVIGLRARGALRRVMCASSLLGVCGIAATWLGGDVLQRAFVYQAQPWRALWLAHWLGLAGVAMLLVRLLRNRDPLDALALLGLAATELGPALAAPGVVSATALALGLCGAGRARRTVLLLLAGFALLFLQVLAWHLLAAPLSWTVRTVLARREPLIPPVFADPAVVTVVLMLAWRLLRRNASFISRLPVGAAASIMAVTVILDSARELAFGAERFDGVAERAELLARLPRDGTIFWGVDGSVGWFSLRYPVYLSVMQTAGTVFSRAGALEADRRARHVESILGPSPYMRWSVTPEPSAGTDPGIDAARLARLCRDPVLSGVFLSDGSTVEGSMPLHLRSGRRIGSLAFCEDPSGAAPRPRVLADTFALAVPGVSAGASIRVPAGAR